MDDDVGKTKREYATAMRAARELTAKSKRLPKTHQHYLDLLLDTMHRIVEFTLDEVLLECGSDELAYPRRLKLVSDARDEVRRGMLEHQLKLEGITEDEHLGFTESPPSWVMTDLPKEKEVLEGEN